MTTNHGNRWMHNYAMLLLYVCCSYYTICVVYRKDFDFIEITNPDICS